MKRFGNHLNIYEQIGELVSFLLLVCQTRKRNIFLRIIMSNKRDIFVTRSQKIIFLLFNLYTALWCTYLCVFFFLLRF